MDTTMRCARSRRGDLPILAALLVLMSAAPSGSPSAAQVAKRAPTAEPGSAASQPGGEGSQSGSAASQPASPPAGAPSGPAGMHAHHRFTDTATYVQMFEDPSRAEWQKPSEVVAALRLVPGQTVADIGAGSGYFAFPIAKTLGPAGKVYAVDIEQGMLDYMSERAKKEQVGNVVTVLAAPDDPRLGAGSVDLVFICDTWHHIDSRVAYLRGLAPALRPGARIAIVDYQKRPLPVGPTVESKIERTDVVRELGEAGFALIEEPTFLPYQYFLIFAAAAPSK